MSGLTTPEITKQIEKTSLEMRDGFEFRELNKLYTPVVKSPLL
jgi:hypothetical protein